MEIYNLIVCWGFGETRWFWARFIFRLFCWSFSVSVSKVLMMHLNVENSLEKAPQIQQSILPHKTIDCLFSRTKTNYNLCM